MKQVTAGIDIGGIDSEIGIAGQDGKLYKKARIITKDFPDVRDFIARCHSVIGELARDFDLGAIGVAAPNGNPYHGTIENAVNLTWKGVIPFVEIMSSYTSLPVVLTNDAKAAAVGEKLFGGAREMDNFILVTLGTGLGSGIYTHGHLLTGHLGLAGELGHTIIEDNGRMCNTNRQGCLEAYASVTGIRRTVLSLLSRSVTKSSLRNLSFDDLDGQRIFLAAREKDPVAMEAFEYTGKILGRGLANAASLLDPEAIFLAGGLAHAGDLILKPTL
ncbi:MAG TPA: ROK family protein, partial [Chryseosolibacter sp.]|nr:ROK family protein [Chryseosolibacter sp.]